MSQPATCYTSGMSEYTFSNLLSYNMAEIAALVNAGFAEYYRPVRSDASAAASFMRISSLDLTHSLAMHAADGQFVGLSRLGARGKRGWLGGFALVPAFRGQGVGKLLLDRQLVVAREAGLTSLQLEVLIQNERAMRLYAGAGFVPQYGHIELAIELAALAQHVTTAKVQPAEPEKLHDWLLTGRQPIWYRERSSLVAIGGEGLVAMRPGGATAAIIYRRRAEQVTLYAAALIDPLSANDLALLIQHVGGERAEIELTDLPADRSVLQACRALGFQDVSTQHEMLLAL